MLICEAVTELPVHQPLRQDLIRLSALNGVLDVAAGRLFVRDGYGCVEPAVPNLPGDAALGIEEVIQRTPVELRSFLFGAVDTVKDVAVLHVGIEVDAVPEQPFAAKESGSVRLVAGIVVDSPVVLIGIESRLGYIIYAITVVTSFVYGVRGVGDQMHLGRLVFEVGSRHAVNIIHRVARRIIFRQRIGLQILVVAVTLGEIECRRGRKGGRELMQIDALDMMLRIVVGIARSSRIVTGIGRDRILRYAVPGQAGALFAHQVGEPQGIAAAVPVQCRISRMQARRGIVQIAFGGIVCVAHIERKTVRHPACAGCGAYRSGKK